MRVLQNIFVYGSYVRVLEAKARGKASFKDRWNALARDRYCAVHFLEPDESSAESDVFLTSDAYPMLQRAWAAEGRAAATKPAAASAMIVCFIDSSLRPSALAG